MQNSPAFNPAHRALDITAFLTRHGWDDADLVAIENDFSTRRYARLTKRDGKVAILMDAPGEQRTPEFVALAKLLCGYGLHAPVIYAAHAALGLVLMEDLAAPTFGSLIDGGESPDAYYYLATDVLVTLHKKFKPSDIAPFTASFLSGLPQFDAELFATQAELYLDEYLPLMGVDVVREDTRIKFHVALLKALKPLDTLPQSLLLRDYMFENLLACSDGTTGLLDFQDAGIGPISYDLMSLCEEARRPGGWAYMPQVIDHYMMMAKPHATRDELMKSCTILSVLRHLRVLGIVAGQIHKGRVEKRALLPHITAHLKAVMHDPLVKDTDLADLHAWLDAHDLAAVTFS